MAIKAGQHIKLLDGEMMWAVVTHPTQRENIARVAHLIRHMRSCSSPADYNDFQRYLFRDLHSIEELRGGCSRVIKRLKRGQQPPADAPVLPTISNPHDLASWEFENYILERVARQLRTVGDGLAWRVFGYDRRIILTLSRNQSAGPMYGKEGLPYELGRIEDLWNSKSHFALLHDLTNCLRIADITEFTADGGALFHEVKKTPRIDPRQMTRIQSAVNAVMKGDVLPGDNPDARLVPLVTPYATDLAKLNDLVQLAKHHGARGMRLPPGRALIAASLETAAREWGNDPHEGIRKLESIKQRAIKRAGIVDATHHVRGNSGDVASRSPILPPWSIYPLDADDCAALTCDSLVFETILSPDALVEEAAASGLRAEVLLPHEHGEIGNEQEIVRFWAGDRALILHSGGLSPLLYELVQPRTWIAGVREALELKNPPDEPVLAFAAEEKVWRV